MSGTFVGVRAAGVVSQPTAQRVRSSGSRRLHATAAAAARIDSHPSASHTACGSRSSTAWGSSISPVSGSRHLSRASDGSSRSRRSLIVRAVFEKFTERAIKAVMLAQQEAKNLGVMEVTAQHILLGLIAEGASKDGYMGTDITLENARTVVEVMSSKRKKRDVKELPFSRDSKRVFEAALTESRRLGMNFIAPEHIIIACLTLVDSGARAVIMKMDADVNVMKAEAISHLKGEKEADTGTKKRRSTTGGTSKQKKEQKMTEEYCTDLNAAVRLGKSDPVFGREKEVRRLSQILARRTKNNPILLGEPGVGKTAIAEGLARAIVTGVHSDGEQVPEFLLGKRILNLDVGLMVAGAKERGELENRVTKLIAECKADKSIILMIDEIHMLVGAGAVGRGGGGGGGGLDISNLMKPALARADLQVIGATTLDEHRKYIEKDAALERRFQPVTVREPNQEDTLKILQGLREAYEQHHHCTYTEEALEAAVKLSHRYVADRFMPDKAIDLVDEAGSRARIHAFFSRKSATETMEASSSESGSAEWEMLNSQVEELKQVLKAKSDAISEGLYEEAALLRKRETMLKEALRSPEHAEYAPLPEVTEADMEAVVSAWTGIPVERMVEGQADKLTSLADNLRSRVVGQSNAISAIARAMRRNCSGLKDPKRPIGGFLFCGPTGVGKTEVTKALADSYFGDESALIRLDMSEYMERHSVSKLVGAPPGYVGHGEGGKLTEAVRRKPFSIVLLDEIEKAHPDIFNILLQVLEDGQLTDSQGRTVSFKNTLIIMTSNIGSSVISKGGGSLGFQMPSDDPDGGKYERIRSLVLEEIKGYFRPEMLNRLDEIVVFHQLSREEIRTIADMVLKETASRLEASRGAFLQVTERAMEKILEEGFDEAYGARPLRRAVMTLVDDALSDVMLAGDVMEGDVVTIDAREDTGEVVCLLPEDLEDFEEDVQVVYSSTSATF